MKKLSKGMFKDTARVDQPEGTMRDALNANLNDKKGSISNEWGTTEYPNNANFRVLGRAVLDDDKIVMFGQDVFNTFDDEGDPIVIYTDQIRILDTRNQVVRILYENDALNFQQSHPIVTTSRKNQAGEYLVYFTDGYENEEEIYEGFDYVTEYNPPRVINVTRQEEFLDNGGGYFNIYNNTNSYYKLQLSPRIGAHATFQNATIIAGGMLPCAAYYLAIAYADEDGLETNYYTLSNPVYIAPGPENVLPTNSFIGAEGGTVTSKAIQWTVQVPPGVDYEMIQPAILKLEKSTLTAVKLAPQRILTTPSNVVITYAGTEDVATISTNDILIDDVNYITADTINQLDNRLYMGNIGTNKDIGFQPFTYNIMVDAVVEEQPRFDPRLYDMYILNSGYSKLMQAFWRDQGQQFDENVEVYTDNNATEANPAGSWNIGNRVIQDDYAQVLRTFMADQNTGETYKGYRTPAYSFARKTYRRGEVYAFYISFVLNDGSETYAYHIPGRPAQCMPYEPQPETVYEVLEWVKVTVTQETVDTSILGNPLVLTTESEYVFALAPGTTVLGYQGGYYRTGASDTLRANQFDTDDLPATLSLVNTPATLSEGFVGTTGFTAGSAPTGDLLSWINSYGEPLVTPIPPATSSWISVTVQTKAPGTQWLESEETIFIDEVGGEMCEDEVMREYTNFANRSAHGFRPEEIIDADRNVSIYTSDRVDSPTGMGYWENKNEVYPTTNDFILGQVNPDGTAVLNAAQTLHGQRVRHHKMPSNLTDRGFISRRITEIEGSHRPNEEALRAAGGRLETPEALDPNGYLLTSENINLLGIRLRNVKIPRSILGQVQGYKIYYAKREQKDKTIFGQSIAVPGHPRYGASPKQSLEDAVSGPYIKAFYMYGGLDHTDNSTVFTLGKWKGEPGQMSDEIRLQQMYLSHPVFKFHDFNMLRKRTDLSAVTHIQCQYGVAFRHYAGGPGVFVKPCQYDKIWNAPNSFEENATLDAKLNIYHSSALQGANQGLQTAYSTTFPSLGWVSPQMRNTVDFYWHGPRWEAGDANVNTKGADLLGFETRILNISDKDEGEITTILRDSTNALDTADNRHEKGERAASRVKARLSGLDGNQPADDSSLNDSEKLLAVKAKEARIRAWWTSAMVATLYVSPRVVLGSRFMIKAGDAKEWGEDAGIFRSQNWYKEGNFDDNQLTLAIEAGGKILLHGRDNHSVKDSASFKGVDMLFNRAGETAHAFSLISGLPALRGHLPFYSAGAYDQDGVRSGLTRWGEAINYLYPDAAIDGVPLAWKKFNLGGDALPGLQSHNPKDFRGLSYSLQKNTINYGMPMAWLVNICAIRTDVFNPFDKQKLVWTGYYHKIYNPDLETGEAGDFQGNISNYYDGGESRNIFGGDTYISKYSFRTTSQSYGHSYFRASWTKGDAVGLGQTSDGDTGYIDYLNDKAITTNLDRFQGDIPAVLDPRKWKIWAGGDTDEQPNPILNRFGTTNGFPVWAWNFVEALENSDDYEDGDTGAEFTLAERAMEVLQDSRNWVKGNVNPVSTVFTFMCETDDLVGFRHVDDEEKGEDTMFFDYNNANKVIFADPTNDLTKPDKLLYEDHYSALQDKKVTFPLPVYGELQRVQRYPNRVVRSDVDSGSLADGYRKFRALEFKDIPAHRGDIMNLFDLQGNLYIHTERSLFVTKGKEELQLSAVTAFIGSGNIFVQDPDESMQADAGHGGTTSRHAHVTTPYGHFYVNYRDRKVYSVTQGIQDITAGMETWLRENIPFVVEQYGINLDSDDARNNGFFLDATTGVNVPLGFTLGYDPLFKRILITKHEPVPTQQFLEDFWAGNIVITNNIPELIGGCDNGIIDPPDDPDETARKFTDDGILHCAPIWFGNPRYFTQRTWTISYYPEMQVWGSRHSYGPNLYTNTSEYMISFANNGTWEHSNELNPGRFYGQVYNFEVEFIDNTAAAESKIFPNFFYWAESFLPNQNSISEQFRVSNPVFDEFYAYNSTQITGLPTAINYLNNARLVDRMWFINDVRDLSVQQQLTEGELITGTENVAGNITTSVTTHPQNITMFTEEGVVNNNYVNVNKEWYNRRKLVDHFMGVRLIKDNTNRNLVHLYAVGTKFRKSFR
jgi:hypothetical protein